MPFSKPTWMLAGVLLCQASFLGLEAGSGSREISAGNIGLFVPDDGGGRFLGREVIRAARLALSDFREEAASANIPGLQIIPSELPWGDQTGRLADSIYEKDVVGIIGALDSRTAHLAAQVVTRAKGRAVFLTLSGDPTLTQINIPWVFRVVPDNRVQLRTLIHALRSLRNVTQVGVLEVSNTGLGLGERANESETNGTEIIRLCATNDSRSPECEREVSDFPGGALIVLGDAADMAFLKNFQLDRRGYLGLGWPFSFPEIEAADRSKLPEVMRAGPVFSRSPEDRHSSEPMETFQRTYKQTFGEAPSSLAAYAYDATWALLRSLERVRRTEMPLADALREFEGEGVTGYLGFDMRGNRRGTLGLAGSEH